MLLYVTHLEVMYKKYKTGHLVSNQGAILCKRNKKNQLKTFITNNGYECFSYGGTSYYVHRVVWETFKGLIPDNLCINHKNGIKLDNNLSNLEVVTYKENMQHAMKLGLFNPSRPAETNSMSKLTNQAYYELISMIMQGSSNSEIAKYFNLHNRYVSLVRGKKRLITIWKEFEKNNGIHPIPTSQDNSKFTLVEKLNIIGLLSKYTNKELAEKIDVDPSVISRLRSKLTWKNAWKIYDSKVQRSFNNEVGLSNSKRGTSLADDDMICSY